MTDGIIKGNGNSRYLKTVADALTLYPTYQDFMAAFIAGTLPVDLNGINAEGWAQIGTALNKGTLLKDETAAKIGLDANAVPDDAFGTISEKVIGTPVVTAVSPGSDFAIELTDFPSGVYRVYQKNNPSAYGWTIMKFSYLTSKTDGISNASLTLVGGQTTPTISIAADQVIYCPNIEFLFEFTLTRFSNAAGETCHLFALQPSGQQKGVVGAAYPFDRRPVLKSHAASTYMPAGTEITVTKVH